MPRPLVEQTFTQVPFTAGTVPLPIAPQFGITAMIASFIVCVPQGAANPVYFGDETVSVNTGLELGVGTSVNFDCEEARELYELEYPLLFALKTWLRVPILAYDVPYTVWNLQRCFLVASAPTDVRIMIFRTVFL